MAHQDGTSASSGVRGNALTRWFRGLGHDFAHQVWGTAHRAIYRDVSQTLLAVTRKPEARESEAFEDAVRRRGLSAADLATSFRAFRAGHLALYFVGMVLLAYSLVCFRDFGFLVGMPAAMLSLLALIAGYLQGFRAWQIQNRNLIRLEDAVRNASTYLIL